MWCASANQDIVEFSIRSLFIRYRQDVHLKALRKEEWLR